MADFTPRPQQCVILDYIPGKMGIVAVSGQ